MEHDNSSTCGCGLAREARKPDEKQLDADLKFASNDNPVVYNLTMWRNNIVAHTSKLFKASTLSKNMIGQWDYSFVMESVQMRIDEQEKRMQAKIEEALGRKNDQS